MSYNITNWTTKVLRDLVIPLKALHISDDLIRQDWQPGHSKVLALNDEKMNVEMAGFGEGTARGKLWSPSGKVDYLFFAVSDICVYGEGSGRFFMERLKPALEQSTGRLEAILVWEGGDSISRLTVQGGIVTDESIEL